MADQQRPGEAAGAGVIDDEELALEAPDPRLGGRAPRCGRACAARPDAPLGGARDGGGGPRALPGRPAGHRAGGRGRLLLRLRAAAPADAGRPRRRSRRGCATAIAADHPFVRARARPSTRRARSSPTRGQAFKVEILDDLARRPPSSRRADPPVTTFYEHGSVPSTCAAGRTSRRPGRIGPFRCSPWPGRTGAGDEKRPMLQRIYGTVWETQEELDRYLWRREEAKKRDHRRLGVAARPLQLPRRQRPDPPSGTPRASGCGGRSRVPMRELQERRGYEEISTPILVNQRLWEQSGHWDALPGQHVPARHRGPGATRSSR